MGCQRPPREGFCWATNRMRSGIVSREMLPSRRAIASPNLLPLPHCSRSSQSSSFCLFNVNYLMLWATRWRRPSAAANPQGFGWPATPPLTHFVARVMLIRLIDCPSMKIGREQSSLGLVVAQLSCLWLALASLALFEPIAVAVHFEDVDVVGQPVE